MALDAPSLAVLAVLGFVGGLFSGLLGIGGAIIIVPMLFYVPSAVGVGQLDMKVIAAITIVQVFFASVSGVVAHQRNRMVSRDLVIYMGGPILVGSLAGAVGSVYLKADILTILFASLALVAAIMMFIPRKEQGQELTADQVTFNKPMAVAIAFTIGILAGILGVGGAFILIPMMLYVLQIPTRVAIGSTLGIVLLSSIAGLAGKLGTGQVPLTLAAALVAGALPGAQLGGIMSRNVRIEALRLILSVVIAGTAIKMWYDVLAASW